MAKAKKSKKRGRAGESGKETDHFAQRVPPRTQRIFRKATDPDVRDPDLREFNRLYSIGEQLAGAMFVWAHLLPLNVMEYAVDWGKNPKKYNPEFGEEVKDAFRKTYRPRLTLDPPLDPPPANDK